MNMTPDLTRRERDVLACVARGLQNDEIAHELGISTGTVKSHLHTAFAKLGVENRTQAAILVLTQSQDSEA